MADIQKYADVKTISKMTGISRTYILEMCHARGAKFAFKPGGENGKFLIDIEKFKNYLERRIRNE